MVGVGVAVVIVAVVVALSVTRSLLVNFLLDSLILC